MKHYGDITKLSGYELPIVDCITGGSPCQDLSVAGLRAGLDGERSGLFMEQIRIIKEMREHDRQLRSGRPAFDIRPRYMVWENVPGAFSSNKGEDFRIVLEETAKIADENAVIPRLEGKQKWSNAGCILADGWSIAWRVHDAQFWGVPQRRKRISLVADFGGQSAPEICFERKGLHWDSEESGAEREGIAGDAEERIDTAICLQGNGIDRADTAGCNGRGWSDSGVSYTLNTIDRPAVFSIDALSSNSMKSKNPYSGCRQVECSRTLDCADLSPAKNQGGLAIVYDAYQHHGWRESGTIGTLTSDQNKSVRGNTPLISGIQSVMTLQSFGEYKETGSVSSLKCRDYKDACDLVVSAVDCRNGTENYHTNGALQSKKQGYRLNSNNVCRTGPLVRRLTPLECERLQGFPDGWTDIGEWIDSKGKKHKNADSPRYKALGNSIALPFWFYLLRRISAQYERPATLGSLFDGIGGFPLCWERCNGKGTAIWASEIEEFPIAVTKKHFPEEDNDEQKSTI